MILIRIPKEIPNFLKVLVSHLLTFFYQRNNHRLSIKLIIIHKMIVPRFGHTLTQLPDGRILAVGGSDMRSTTNFPAGTATWQWASTDTAELYNPSTNK